MTQPMFARVLIAYDHALAVLSEALGHGDVERRLGNKIINPVFSVRGRDSGKYAAQ